MIKIGIIGAGFMGRTHAECYQALKAKYDFRVTAIADAELENARSLAEIFGAKAYEGGLSLIKNADVNTVDICLPTYLHSEHMIGAMMQGYNVLVEKPVCLNELEAMELLKVQQETGANVMVAHCIRFWDEYAYLKDLMESNEYGSIISGSFFRISPRPNWYWGGWGHDREKSGSAVLDMHIHDVDYVRFLLGEPHQIKTMVTRSAENGNPEHIYTLYKYEDKTISIEGGWDYPAGFPFTMSYRVKFQKALVVFNSNEKPTVRVFTEIGKVYSPEFNFESSVNSGYYKEIDYFLHTLIAGVQIKNASMEDAIVSLKLLMRETRES